MTLRFLMIAIMLVTVAACKQPQEPKAAPGMPAGVMMKTADEIKQLEAMVKQAPQNGDAWIVLGNALMDSNRFIEAAEAYQKALVIYPKNVDVRVDMGTCFKNSGRPEKAIEEYRKAIKIDPKHLYARRNMGVVLAFDLKDTKAAITQFEKYLELSPAAHDAADIRRLVQDLKAGK